MCSQRLILHATATDIPVRQFPSVHEYGRPQQHQWIQWNGPTLAAAAVARQPPSLSYLNTADRPVGRHAAIRTKLPDWSSYRSWVDKARGSWDEKKIGAASNRVPGNSPRAPLSPRAQSLCPIRMVDGHRGAISLHWHVSLEIPAPRSEARPLRARHQDVPYCL